MSEPLAIAYSATAISISGRLVFMYLLYTKKSTNPISLLFIDSPCTEDDINEAIIVLL